MVWNGVSRFQAIEMTKTEATSSKPWFTSAGKYQDLYEHSKDWQGIRR